MITAGAATSRRQTWLNKEVCHGVWEEEDTQSQVNIFTILSRQCFNCFLHFFNFFIRTECIVCIFAASCRWSSLEAQHNPPTRLTLLDQVMCVTGQEWCDFPSQQYCPDKYAMHCCKNFQYQLWPLRGILGIFFFAWHLFWILVDHEKCPVSQTNRIRALQKSLYTDVAAGSGLLLLWCEIILPWFPLDEMYWWVLGSR